MQSERRLIRLSLATLALASATLTVGPGASLASASEYPSCTSLGCTGGPTKCATFTVDGILITCYIKP